MRSSLTQIFQLTLACVLLVPALSQAQDGGCEKVLDKDKQVICMAASKKEVKLCDGMSSNNGKYFCQALCELGARLQRELQWPAAAIRAQKAPDGKN